MLDPINCWLFDLDMTLYPPASNLFAAIERRMGEFVAATKNLSPDAARAVQKRYFRDHGTTLAGLMLHDGVDPDDFLDFVHNIDLSALKPAPQLADAIIALPGRKIVFTNADERHAGRVLAARGLDGLFDQIHDIAASGYRPKPDQESFARLIGKNAIDPVRAILFDDIAANLAAAKMLGMTTVWVKEDCGVPLPDFVDYRTDDLECWLKSWQRGTIHEAGEGREPA